MKKILLAAALIASCVASQAQVTVQGSKFSDNWSLTLKGGGIAPYQHYKFWPSMRGIAGLELRKQVTSVLGVGLEGEWTVNTSSWNTDARHNVYGPHSKNVFDHQFVGLFNTVNFTNWFLGYNGSPRTLEVEAVLGAGWWHAYQPSSVAKDANSWYTKAGLNLNLNLCDSKAWTLALKPAVVWNMGRGYSQGTTAFNANHAAVELEAGLTYHFGNSNGEHYMTLCPKQYTQADLDEVNAKVNDLRSQLSQSQAELDASKAREKQLARDLNACKQLKNKVVTVQKDGSESLETNVFFDQGKSVVSRAQMPNVERVATFLKNHKGAKVEIVGYASPEGSKEINERIAANRANAVKDLLVKNYKISSSRIKAKGQGVGDMFSEPDWNRVSICTIITKAK